MAVFVLIFLTAGAIYGGMSFASRAKATPSPSPVAQPGLSAAERASLGDQPNTSTTVLQVTDILADKGELGSLLAKALQVSGEVSVGTNLTVKGAATAATFTGDGAGLTNVDAALLNGRPGSYYASLNNLQGQLSDTQLSSNVALKSDANIFSASNIFGGTTTINNLVLGSALTVATGGTGATTAGAARTNLGAAAAGANTDITSLAGLTTALSVGQGGTGLTSLTAGGILIGNGTAAVTALTGTNGQCLVMSGAAPAFGSCINNIGATTDAGGASRIFSDGFESGNYAQWGYNNFSNGASAPSITTTTVHSGKYATKINIDPAGGAGVGVGNTLPGAPTTVVRAYVNFASQASTADILDLSDGTVFRDFATGKLGFWNPNSGAATLSNAVFTTGVWHKVEWVITVDPSAGASSLYVDDVNVLNLTNINTGSANPTDFFIGDNGSGRTAVYYVDDVTLDTVRPGADSNLNINDNLHVGGSVSVGGPVLVRPGAESGELLQIQNAGGWNIVTVDSKSDNLVLGTPQGINSKLVFNNNANTNEVSLSVQDGTAAYDLKLPSALGATGDCLVDSTGTGVLAFGSCAGGSSGVSSLNGQTGAVSIAGATASAGTVTINNATTATKGIASFNATNFTASSGAVNTVQDIAVTSTPIFGSLTLTTASGLTLGAANTATGDIIFNGAGGAGTLKLLGPNIPNVGNFALTIPAITANANLCTDNAICSGYASSAALAGYVQLQGATPGTAQTGSLNITGTAIAGVLQAQPAADSLAAPSLAVLTSAGNNALTVAASSAFTQVGIALGGSTLPAITGNGLQIQGSLRLSGGWGGLGANVDNFTTPGGSTITTKLNIPTYDPGAFNSMIALGVPFGANSQARAIAVFDDRAPGDSQPVVGVLSPDETSIGGFVWDGSNSVFKLKTNSSNVATTAGITVKSGDANSGSGLTSGDINITTGAGGGTGNSSGSIWLDSGAKTGAGTAGSINIGLGNASAVTIGNNSNPVHIQGSYFEVVGTTTNNTRMYVGGNLNSAATTNHYGLQDEVTFAPTGASLNNIFGSDSIAVLGTSAVNVGAVQGSYSRVDTNAGYTGQITSASGYHAGSPQLAGTKPITSYSGVLVDSNTANVGASGNAVTNYGVNVTTPAADSAFTTNYGVYIQGNGGGSATSYSLYNASAAPSYFAGNIGIGAPTDTGSASRIFSDGFESGNYAQWGYSNFSTGASVPSISTTTVHTGKYATKVNIAAAGGAGVDHAINGAPTVVVRAYVNFSSQSTGVDLLNLSNGTVFRDSATGKLAFWNDTTSTGTLGNTVLTTGVWHKVEWIMTTNSTTGAASLYLDDVNVLSLTNINTGSVNPTDFFIGDTNTGRTGVYYVDDVTVDTVRPGAASNLNVNDNLHVGGSAGFGGPVLVQPGADSSALFQVQNSAGQNIVTVDSNGGDLLLGEAGADNAYIYFHNLSNSNAVSLSVQDGTAAYDLKLPSALGASGNCLVDTTGTGVLGFANCGMPAANQTLSNLSGTTAINSSLVPGVNNSIDAGSSGLAFRNGFFGTSVQSPLFDANSAAALNIGSVNATAINLNANTTIASGKTLSVTTALNLNSATITGAGLSTDCSATNSKLLWSSSTSQFSCGTDRASLLIRKSGDTTFTNTTTLQNDPDMTFSIGANETWVFQADLTALDTNTTSQYDYAVTAPAGASCRFTGFSVDDAVSNSTSTCGGRAFVPTFQANQIESHMLYGTIQNGATPGTVTIQYSQHAANAGSNTIYANGFLVGYKLTGADLAEAYYTTDPSIQAGDIVAIDPSAPARVRKPTSPYDSSILGVISTKPGQVLADADHAPTGRPVMLALAGRIPVKVSTENGPIAPGDPLTSSSIPGVAMKATRPGQIIGKALEGYSETDPKNIGFVMIFAGQSYSNAGEGGSMQGGLMSASTLTASQANIASLNVSGQATISSLTVTGTAVLAELQVTGNAVIAGTLTVNGHVVTGGTAPTVATTAASVCGGAAAAQVDGNDTAGIIQISVPAAASCPAPGQLAALTFAGPFAAAPKVTLTPANADAAQTGYYYDNATSTDFDLKAAAVLHPGHTYRFSYHVEQ